MTNNIIVIALSSVLLGMGILLGLTMYCLRRKSAKYQMLQDEHRDVCQRLREAHRQIEECKLSCLAKSMRLKRSCPFAPEPDLAQDDVTIIIQEGATHVESD